MAIWVTLDTQAVADARTAAAVLAVAASTALIAEWLYGKLARMLQASVQDKVAERLADAAVASQRAVLSTTRPMRGA